MGLLDGKVAFVTGAARSQGRSHAVRFAQEGADIVAVDLCAPLASPLYPPATEDDLAETVAQVEALDRRIFSRVGDVRDHRRLNEIVDEATAELGTVDIVVANAGISPLGGLLDVPQEDWQEVIDINLTGVFNTIRAGVRGMVERGDGGSVILISSILGLRSLGGMPHYTAAKHGVVGLMRSAALDLAPYRIRVNSVHPGNVNTIMTANEHLARFFRPDLEHPVVEDALPGLAAMNALPEAWVQPGDISEAVLWLASEASRYVTGITLPVDLGQLLK